MHKIAPVFLITSPTTAYFVAISIYDYAAFKLDMAGHVSGVHMLQVNMQI